MNASKTTSVAIVLGATLGAALSPLGAAQAQAGANPFAVNELDGGYMLLAEASGDGKTQTEGKCGEGKCGANKKDGKSAEGKCGGDKTSGEGKCGGSK